MIQFQDTAAPTALTSPKAREASSQDGSDQQSLERGETLDFDTFVMKSDDAASAAPLDRDSDTANESTELPQPIGVFGMPLITIDTPQPPPGTPHLLNDTILSADGETAVTPTEQTDLPLPISLAALSAAENAAQANAKDIGTAVKDSAIPTAQMTEAATAITTVDEIETQANSPAKDTQAELMIKTPSLAAAQQSAGQAANDTAPTAATPDSIDTEIDLKRADKTAAIDNQIDTQLQSRAIEKQGLLSAEAVQLTDTKSVRAESQPLAIAAAAPAVSTANTAAPTLISAALPTPLDKPSVAALAQNIIKTLETQKGVSVRLDPPEMGRVYIDYQFDRDNSVTAMLRADTPEILAQLRDNASALQEFLKQSGFDTINLSFEQSSLDHGTPQGSDYDENAIPFEDDQASFYQPAQEPRATSLHQSIKYGTLSIDIKL